MGIRRVAPIPQAMMDELYSKNITVERAKVIQKKIQNRFYYVFMTAMDILHWGVDWFAFDNHKGDGDFGSFLPGKYKKNIPYDGNFFARETDNTDFNEFLYDVIENYTTIPTRWLSENFEAALKAEFKAGKEKALKKSREENNTIAELQASIKAKLTKAELAQIRFNVVLPAKTKTKTKTNTKVKAKSKAKK